MKKFIGRLTAKELAEFEHLQRITRQGRIRIDPVPGTSNIRIHGLGPDIYKQLGGNTSGPSALDIVEARQRLSASTHLSRADMEAIETAIETRIGEHEAKHEGLYGETDLEALRPVWRKAIIKECCEILDIMDVEL